MLIELQKNVTCQIEKTKFESRSEPEVFSGLCSSSGTVSSISPLSRVWFGGVGGGGERGVLSRTAAGNRA